MLEQWRQCFERDGEVDVYTSRSHMGWGMLGLGVVCVATAAYLLLTPRPASFLPLGVLRVGGVVAALGALVVVPFGAWMLGWPKRIVRLDPQGVTPWRTPTAWWAEVEGVSTTRIGGVTFAEVHLDDAYWARIREIEPGRRLDQLRRNGTQPGRIMLIAGAPGGGDALMRLILWARDRQRSGD